MELNINKRKLSLKNKILLNSGIIWVLLIVLVYILSQRITTMAETSDWIDHTNQVLQNASTIEKLVVDMETGERGFLISGKKEFLEPYEVGKKKLSSLLVETKELISDNPQQVRELKGIENLVARWQEKAGVPEIKKRSEVAKNSKTFEVFERLHSRTRGKEIFDKIRYELEAIQSKGRLEDDLKVMILVLKTANALLDMETGQRGFLLSGKEESLEPFIRGQKNYKENIKKLETLGGKSKGRHIIKRSLRRIILLTDQWLDETVKPEILARREVNKLTSTMEDVTTLIEKNTGKRIMDDIRYQMNIFKQREYELLKARKLESDRSTKYTKYMIIWGTVFIIFISNVFSLRLAENITEAN